MSLYKEGRTISSGFHEETKRTRAEWRDRLEELKKKEIFSDPLLLEMLADWEWEIDILRYDPAGALVEMFKTELRKTKEELKRALEKCKSLEEV